MAEHVGFGRRGLSSRAAPLIATKDYAALSADAEAFCAGLTAESKAPKTSFEGWLRTRRGHRLLAWLVTFALLTPGGLCFVLKAPASASGGLEVIGLALSFWLRRQRRKHLSEIANWADQD